jgi:4-amino-4-deoxy-L-arabinose transferase-like glycosyltransferase
MTIGNQTTLSKNENRTKWLIRAVLAAVLLLAAFLRFYQLGANGYGNTYYAATVKSMLVSWHNFFFAAYEPGGSVSVDKPPIGFWIEALSALIFGFNGFALAFPNALAGVLSVYLVYALVQKPFGKLPGLVAALALAATPVTVAAERNNTIDGMLVFFLLLAAWAVFRSVETKKVGWLMVGALFVGLAFNIKMLQAYMVLPALYMLYFFGARYRWGQRLTHLALATVLLLAVSLSWALIVDAVPASQRPYVGSSTNNSELELIIGHNGIERFNRAINASGSTGPAVSAASTPSAGLSAVTGHPSISLESGALNVAAQSTPAPATDIFEGTLGVLEAGLGGVIYEDLGSSGILRLFRRPLAVQASWLLPLALISILLFALLQRKLGASRENRLGVLFWAAWLIPCLLVFSFTDGLWHVYYLIMLGPAIAALAGVAFWLFERMAGRSNRWYWVMLTGVSLFAVAFELYAVSSYVTYFRSLAILLTGCWVAAVFIFWVKPGVRTLAPLMLALIIGPLLWSGLAGVNSSADSNLPRAEPAMPASSSRQTYSNQIANPQQSLVSYLLANTRQNTYLVASLDSFETSGFILATSRPVLALGGFKGLDNVVDVTGLAGMVRTGQLRYVLDAGDLHAKPQIYTWVKQNCPVVQASAVQVPAAVETSSSLPTPTIYDCGGGR